MKKLFTFKLDRDTKETVKESSKNEKGETVTTEKEVVKSAKQKVFLKKPTRSLFDEAELFYGVKLSEGIKAGLLTRALLAKRFSNDGGVLSEDDKDRYSDLYIKLYEQQLDIERMSSTPESKRTKDETGKLGDALENSADLRQQLTDFEMAQSSLFEQTAENRARNKTILWWSLNLSHLESEDGDSESVFEGSTYEEKLASYDVLEESEDEFHEELLQKLVYYVSFWYVGKINTQKDFEELLKDSGEEIFVPEEPAKEEPAKEEPAKEEPAKEEPHECPTGHKGTPGETGKPEKPKEEIKKTTDTKKDKPSGGESKKDPEKK
jgi:hypothetical protein